jgi:hypothetical protein
MNTKIQSCEWKTTERLHAQSTHLVDLIEKVERSGIATLDRKNDCQRDQSFLTPRQLLHQILLASPSKGNLWKAR